MNQRDLHIRSLFTCVQAIECLSALTVRKALLSAVTNLTKEFTDHPHPHPEESVQDRPETSNGNVNHNYVGLGKL